MKRATVLVSALAALSCGPSGSSGESPTYCEINLIVEKKCQRCHTDSGDMDTPFNLESYDEVMDQVMAIELVIERGTMPMQVTMEPPVEPLTAAEKEAILDWIDAGTPQGDCE